MEKKQSQYPMRTRFAKEIVSEFLPPTRKSNKVIILLAGAPTYPGKRAGLMPFFADKGYWVFLPRYRGTWESGGSFLKKSPHLDVLDVMSGVEKGFLDLYSGKKYRVAKPEFYLIGGSFGGPATIFASRDKRVKKAFVISPVIDWRRQEETTERLSWLAKVIPLAWGESYRGAKDVWQRLGTTSYYSPIHQIRSVDGEKLLFLHAADDDVVPLAPTRDFAKTTGAKFIGLRKGGHLGLALATKNRFWRRIERFFKSR